MAIFLVLSALFFFGGKVQQDKYDACKEANFGRTVIDKNYCAVPKALHDLSKED